MGNKVLTEDNKIWLIETLLKSTCYEEFKNEADNYFKVIAQEEKPVTVDIPKEVTDISAPSEELLKEEKQLPPISEEDKKRASIYASEHRSIAMEENNIGSFGNNITYEEKELVSTPVVELKQEEYISIPKEEPKTRTLEPANSNGRKITYENIQVVLPGQLKL